jgi:hypothetical protein
VPWCFGGALLIDFFHAKPQCLLANSMENRKYYLVCLLVCIVFTSSSFSQIKGVANIQKIAVIWQNTQPKGTIEVVNGQLIKLKIVTGKGRITGNSFEFKTKGNTRLEATLAKVQIFSPGCE